MRQGGLPDTSRHASAISAHFCNLTVLSVIVVLATLGLKVPPSRSPKIAWKSIFCQKTRSEERFFADACRDRRFSRIFIGFRLNFELKIDVFSNASSSCSTCFFRNGDPHDSMVFIYSKPLFHVSRCCVFPRKKYKKTVHNCGPKEAWKNDPPGIYFGTRNPWKSTLERPELVKIAEKIEKMACQNSCVFFRFSQQKTNIDVLRCCCFLYETNGY